jgi:hypothetical protein
MSETIFTMSTVYTVSSVSKISPVPLPLNPTLVGGSLLLSLKLSSPLLPLSLNELAFSSLMFFSMPIDSVMTSPLLSMYNKSPDTLKTRVSSFPLTPFSMLAPLFLPLDLPSCRMCAWNPLSMVSHLSLFLTTPLLKSSRTLRARILESLQKAPYQSSSLILKQLLTHPHLSFQHYYCIQLPGSHI